MKAILSYSLAATLAAGASAAAHRNHQHHHVKKHAGSKVEKRDADVVTVYVAGPTATVYELAGEVLDAEEAKDGIDGGHYVVVGESIPTYTPPPPPPEPTTSSAADMGAQFIESQAPTTTSTSTPPPPPPTTSSTSSSAAPPPPPASSSAAPRPPSGGNGATGLNAEFPSEQLSCSEFPSDYGAVPLNWLGLSGWSGVQFLPTFRIGDLSISDIVDGIAGQECGPGATCSYACPPGYQKTQWPEAQGATRQSIGGLYCNSDNLLVLSRPEVKTLCEKGEGGVKIQNDLDEVVSTCRTDYPGNEKMSIPIAAQPGQTLEVCNPSQYNYYIWDDNDTSAQYYVNKKGYTPEEACVWDSPIDPKGAGNWAPTNLGVGKARDGNTYIGIFQNLPTAPDAKLDFNIEIVGDVNGDCWYKDGHYAPGPGSKGCTATMREGGSVTIRYY
jgi:hypothetical protein